jgi:hypothetical protein
MALILSLRPTGLSRGRELLEWRGGAAALRETVAAARAAEIPARSGSRVQFEGQEKYERADLEDSPR